MVTPKSAAEIDQEKAAKSRPDLVPGRAVVAAGRAFAYGAAKHGTPGGRGTYRTAGAEQSRVRSHAASLERHWQAFKAGEFVDPESGLSHLDHMAAQLSIVIDLIEDPPGDVDDDDRRWYEQIHLAQPVELGFPTIFDAMRAMYETKDIPTAIEVPGLDASGDGLQGSENYDCVVLSPHSGRWWWDDGKTQLYTREICYQYDPIADLMRLVVPATTSGEGCP